MGNCTSRTKKKRKGNPALHDTSSRDNMPNEDVLYASIDLGPAKGSRRTRFAPDDDCDYATINVPAALRPSEPESQVWSQGSAKDECDDDYVLMG